MFKNLNNTAINLNRITKKFRDEIEGFTREMIVNAAKSLNNRIKLKDKQKKEGD